jgi:hypothetical protein
MEEAWRQGKRTYGLVTCSSSVEVELSLSVNVWHFELRASIIMGSKPNYMAFLFMWKGETSKSKRSWLSCKS